MLVLSYPNFCIVHHWIKKYSDNDGASRKKLELHRFFIGIIEENSVLKDWYTADGFVHTGTERVDHLPFTGGYLERSV